MLNEAPTNHDDRIDSRDVDERIEELEAEILPWRAKLCDFAGIDKSEEFATHEEARDALAEWLNDHAEFYETREDHKEACEGAAKDTENTKDGESSEFAVGETGLTATIEAAEVDSDLTEELAALVALRKDCEGYGWEHGVTLIRESNFKEYAEELAEELDMIPANAAWPANCIDWDKAARELRMDYTETEFDGVTYLFR